MNGLEMLIALSESPEMSLRERFGQHGKNERVDQTSWVNLEGIMKVFEEDDDERTISEIAEGVENGN